MGGTNVVPLPLRHKQALAQAPRTLKPYDRECVISPYLSPGGNLPPGRRPKFRVPPTTRCCWTFLAQRDIIRWPVLRNPVTSGTMGSRSQSPTALHTGPESVCLLRGAFSQRGPSAGDHSTLEIDRPYKARFLAAELRASVGEWRLHPEERVAPWPLDIPPASLPVGGTAGNVGRSGASGRPRGALRVRPRPTSPSLHAAQLARQLEISRLKIATARIDPRGRLPAVLGCRDFLRSGRVWSGRRAV